VLFRSEEGKGDSTKDHVHGVECKSRIYESVQCSQVYSTYRYGLIPHSQRTARTKMIKKTAILGFKKGLNAYIWMMKIIVPISFLTAFLSWVGILQRIAVLLKPIMNFLGLPGIAAIPMIAGALSSVYAGVATMSVLPFSTEEMILMANFILICHNMIQETVIQANSGIKAWKAVLVRLVAGFITVYALGFFIKTVPTEAALNGSIVQPQISFLEMTANWALSTGRLVLKIFFIILGIMLFLEFAKELDWIKYICLVTKPFLRFMGLSEKVGILWMTAVVFGLAYGGAVIVEEAKNSDIKRHELESLQLSIGINHSMVEDPTLFLPLGLPAFWLWVPRIITAICFTKFLGLLTRYKAG
jgi:hypothetical protein